VGVPCRSQPGSGWPTSAGPRTQPRRLERPTIRDLSPRQPPEHPQRTPERRSSDPECLGPRPSLLTLPDGSSGSFAPHQALPEAQLLNPQLARSRARFNLPKQTRPAMFPIAWTGRRQRQIGRIEIAK
jgi:hypothetical protein